MERLLCLSNAQIKKTTVIRPIVLSRGIEGNRTACVINKIE